MHPLEEEIELFDGRVVKVHGKLAVDWRKAIQECTTADFIRELEKMLNEW